MCLPFSYLSPCIPVSNSIEVRLILPVASLILGASVRFNSIEVRLILPPEDCLNAGEFQFHRGSINIARRGADDSKCFNSMEVRLI